MDQLTPKQKAQTEKRISELIKNEKKTISHLDSMKRDLKLMRDIVTNIKKQIRLLKREENRINRMMLKVRRKIHENN